MRLGLGRRRELLLEVLIRAQRAGRVLSMRDMAMAIGVRSPATIDHHLARLEASGLIMRGARGRVHVVDASGPVVGLLLAAHRHLICALEAQRLGRVLGDDLRTAEGLLRQVLTPNGRR